MGEARAAQLEGIAAVSERDRVLIAAYARRNETMEQTADKVTALLDAAQALEATGATYALIGGVAVGIHTGIPRATLDIDLAVISTVLRAGVIDAMRRAGWQLTGQFEHSANFRHASGEPVRLAFDRSFDPMIERADTMQVAGRTIRIVRKEDLIEMKRRAAADPKRRKSQALRDQADVELLRGDVPDPDEGW
jgi:predicted nucleotidyltransferase